MQVTLKAQPSASLRRIKILPEGKIKIYLNSPPEKGKANLELVKYLSHVLSLPKSAVKITAGETGKEKKIQVDGIEPEEFYSKISREAVDRD